MTDHTAEIDAMARVLVRHRWHETDPVGRGFCGGPACGNGIVTIQEHATHVAEALIAARPTSPAPVRPWCLCDPGPGPHDADCPTQPLSPGKGSGDE